MPIQGCIHKNVCEEQVIFPHLTCNECGLYDFVYTPEIVEEIDCVIADVQDEDIAPYAQYSYHKTGVDKYGALWSWCEVHKIYHPIIGTKIIKGNYKRIIDEDL